jgi:hypothetical protein
MPAAVNVSASHRFAYTIIDPAIAAPGFLLCRVLEERGSNPNVGLSTSDYDAMMLVFASPEAREAAMPLFPLSFEGHIFRLEQPEEGCNRFTWNCSSFVQVSATGFPLEHWSEDGIRAAFCPIGAVCCIDPLCLNELDYSALRVVLKLEQSEDMPPTLLVCDAFGSSSALVSIRIIRSWPCGRDGAPLLLATRRLPFG